MDTFVLLFMQPNAVAPNASFLKDTRKNHFKSAEHKNIKTPIFLS